MAWEYRAGRSPCYTRSRRVNGSVVREYVGVGAAGERAEAEDAARRAERQRQRAARRDDQARWQAVVEPLQDFDQALEQLVQGSLLASGYHQHAHSEWRFRRERRRTPA